MAKEIEFQTAECNYCKSPVETRVPVPLGWDTACDDCMLRIPSSGRVVRQAPAKRFPQEFDSPLDVQQQDQSNLRLWWDMREAYEAGDERKQWVTW